MRKKEKKMKERETERKEKDKKQMIITLKQRTLIKKKGQK